MSVCDWLRQQLFGSRRGPDIGLFVSGTREGPPNPSAGACLKFKRTRGLDTNCDTYNSSHSLLTNSQTKNPCITLRETPKLPLIGCRSRAYCKTPDKWQHYSFRLVIRSRL